MLRDEQYLEMAYRVAQNSDDPSTQNGALLVKGNEIISRGWNSFPVGVVSRPERWERPIKYSYVEHAERSAVFNAALRGRATTGSTMYCCWAACADCARAIILAGVKELVTHDTPLHENASQSWLESIAIAYEMLDEAGVERRVIPATFDQTIRFNGELVTV